MADTATYDLIASQTLASTASTITFSSIPSTYTDLRLTALSVWPGSGNLSLYLTLNSDTGTNYSWTSLYGNGTSAVSGNTTNDSPMQINLVSTVNSAIPSFANIDFFSYAGSTYKTVLSNFSIDKNGSGYALRSVHLWRSTAAINRIDITNLAAFSTNFGVGSTFNLYGIKAA
jgi:hypothetical protein